MTTCTICKQPLADGCYTTRRGRSTHVTCAAVMSSGSAPPLEKMEAHKTRLEAERDELFPKWKEALEATDGNVTYASLAFFPDLEPAAARNKGNRLTRRLELVKFAAGLRVAATGRSRGTGKL